MDSAVIYLLTKENIFFLLFFNYLFEREGFSSNAKVARWDLFFEVDVSLQRSFFWLFNLLASIIVPNCRFTEIILRKSQTINKENY